MREDGDQSRACLCSECFLFSVISFYESTHKLKEGLPLLWDNIFISYNVYETKGKKKL
jgi:hypothetical protein